MKKPLKIVLKLLAVLLMLFTGTFLIYIFNLDMKLTAAIEPWLLKHYDNVPRDRHL
ncbi:MAG: hypothetical protein IK035_08585 [Firmicutes bacterium]|nr:hypothetical protein [Bacillota bacterium]